MELNIGKKYGFRFSIENDFLFIKKRTWFSTKLIKRIECNKIIKLESKDPYSEFAWYKKILLVVLQIISLIGSQDGVGINIWSKQLIVSYFVDEEVAKSGFDVTLNTYEFKVLKEAIQAVLNKPQV